jgi:hypothetical protein
MNLLDIASGSGRSYKKASSHQGGEYHGPCPKCGGTDRFHIWPEQGEHGSFWCRACGLGGDTIEYLMKIDGLTFPEACKQIGRQLQPETEYQAPRFKKPSQDPETFTPRETTGPADLWLQHATKLADWAHEQLLNNPTQLAWLAERGINLDTVKETRLGWNPGEKGKDLYRSREAWGLESVYKEDGTTRKKLWLPIGLVIPCYQQGQLHRLRIRKPEGEPRYYLVPGSGTAPMILGRSLKAFVIVESELDAIMVYAHSRDLAGVISQGNSTAKPDTGSAAILDKALAILIALDSDEAGIRAARWWQQQYPQAERHPVPVGKDPGDAYKAGVDIREWVKLGLPPILTLPKAAPRPLPPQDCIAPGASVPASPPAAAAPTEPETPTVYTVTAADGRTLLITDDPEEYQRLCAEGHIVFNSQELALIKASGLDKQQAARLIDMKENLKNIFTGAVLEQLLPPTEAP